jgi:hypothetical protein
LKKGGKGREEKREEEKGKRGEGEDKITPKPF